MDVNMMSNAELKILMKEMEFEYEALKNKIRMSMDKMIQIDKKYTQVLEILHKRTKGVI